MVSIDVAAWAAVIGFGAGLFVGGFVGMGVLAACQLSSWITQQEEGSK